MGYAGEAACVAEVFTDFRGGDFSRIEGAPPDKSNLITSWFFTRNLLASYEVLEALIDVSMLTTLTQQPALDRVEELLDSFGASEVLALLMVASITRTQRSYLRCLSSRHLALAAIAVERYRLANGALPQTLSDAEAFATPDALTDPMSGELLHYRQEPDGFLLYSVGWNGVDDGAPELDGMPGAQWKEGDWMFWVHYNAPPIGGRQRPAWHCQ